MATDPRVRKLRCAACGKPIAARPGWRREGEGVVHIRCPIPAPRPKPARRPASR